MRDIRHRVCLGCWHEWKPKMRQATTAGQCLEIGTHASIVAAGIVQRMDQDRLMPDVTAGANFKPGAVAHPAASLYPLV